jgi:hypothetical protein
MACSASSSGGDISSACQDYVNALEQSQCATGPQAPASEVSQEISQYVQFCTQLFALPGVTAGSAQLNACSSAVQAAGCNGGVDLPPECSLTGSLASGSACASSVQCKSGACTFAVTPTDGGSTTVGSCGMCTSTVSERGSCLAGGGTACVIGTACDRGTCTKLSFGGEDAACDGVASLCSGDRFCSSDSHTCTAYPSAVGAPCTGRCSGSLICMGTPSTCQEPLPAGAKCTDDEQCTAGLGCDTASQKCASVTWAAGGQSCGNLLRCLEATCVNGTCPVILSDGEACSSSDKTRICGEFSNCVDGTCTSQVNVSCH